MVVSAHATDSDGAYMCTRACPALAYACCRHCVRACGRACMWARAQFIDFLVRTYVLIMYAHAYE